jgi:hypothetical protein
MALSPWLARDAAPALEVGEPSLDGETIDVVRATTERIRDRPPQSPGVRKG